MLENIVESKCSMELLDRFKCRRFADTSVKADVGMATNSFPD
jgi:hypothetical protein